jgi:hypothetical protein
MSGFFALLKLRYSLIFHYGSKKLGYIILKTICLLLFFIPFLAYEIFDFVIELILLIPCYIPIICIVSRFICYILGWINTLLFSLVNSADIIFDSENYKVMEQIVNSRNGIYNF